MKNPYQRLAPKFMPPNQPAPESLLGSCSHDAKTTQKNIALKTRPFDAKFQTAKFAENQFIKKNSELHQTFLQKLAEKDAHDTVAKLPENADDTNSELLAYYFMELSEDQQDDMLVEHEIIIPDWIRKDLKKMSDFIAKNKAAAIDFVPIQEIFSLLKTI